MTEVHAQPTSSASPPNSLGVDIASSSIAMPPRITATRLTSRLALDTYSPVNQNGSFEFDRVIKSGYVQKRTQKTKARHMVAAAISLRTNCINRHGGRYI